MKLHNVLVPRLAFIGRAGRGKKPKEIESMKVKSLPESRDSQRALSIEHGLPNKLTMPLSQVPLGANDIAPRTHEDILICGCATKMLPLNQPKTGTLRKKKRTNTSIVWRQGHFRAPCKKICTSKGSSTPQSSDRMKRTSLRAMGRKDTTFESFAS